MPLKILGYFCLCVLIFMMIGLVIGCISDGIVSQTINIKDYGKIYGNYNNDVPREFIQSFFPESIKGYFTDVNYLYRARKGDTYACECYLEFVIEDTSLLSMFLEKHVVFDQATIFPYDNRFMEYTLENRLDLYIPSYERVDAFSIRAAKVGKILYSMEEKRVIFWALLMHEGGGADTKELGTFFSRFNIDPLDYAQNADSNYKEPAYVLIPAK